MNGTPVHSDDSPVGSTNGTGNEVLQTKAGDVRGGSFLPQHRSIAPAGRPPSLHHVGAEIGSLVSNFMGPCGTAVEQQERSPSPEAGLDMRTLRAFRAYIYPSEGGPKWDEVTLLRRLETEWRDKVRPLQRKGCNSRLFAARDRAFLTWIELRRHLADLLHADESTYMAS
jgi:hypothetical protein